MQLIATCPSLQYVPFADEPAEINFDIGWTSMTFNTGHRIRVAISSSGCEQTEAASAPWPDSQKPYRFKRSNQSVWFWLRFVWGCITTCVHDAADPLYEPNHHQDGTAQTLHPPAAGGPAVTNTILHGGPFKSRIIAPVVSIVHK